MTGIRQKRNREKRVPALEIGPWSSHKRSIIKKGGKGGRAAKRIFAHERQWHN